MCVDGTQCANLRDPLFVRIPDMSRMLQSLNKNDSDHRSSSAMAYLTPVEGLRTNWVTLVGQQVSFHSPVLHDLSALRVSALATHPIVNPLTFNLTPLGYQDQFCTITQYKAHRDKCHIWNS